MYLFLVFGSRQKCEAKNIFRKKVEKSLWCKIILEQQTWVSTGNHPWCRQQEPTMIQLSTHPYSSTWQHRAYVWSTQSFQRKSSIRQTHAYRHENQQLSRASKWHICETSPSSFTVCIVHLKILTWQLSSQGFVRHFQSVVQPLLS